MLLNKGMPGIWLLFILFGACIEKYNIDDLNLNEGSIVISGRITNAEGYQVVEISNTANISVPLFEGVSGCTVLFVEAAGNSFQLQEYKNGKYRVWMDKADLETGKSYQLRVYTPEEKEYASPFEEILSNPEIMDVYGERRDKGTATPGIVQKGVQFYYDFRGNGAQNRFFKIDLLETYEYHTAYPIDWVYAIDPEEHVPKLMQSNIHDEYEICYITQKVPEIFTLTTGQLTDDSFPRFRFHWEYDEPEKFKYKYSLQVLQYAISEDAYRYWKAVEENSQASGGLYSKQPNTIEGNVLNVNDKDEKVLGCFYVASVQTRRFMFPEDFGIQAFDNLNCTPYVADYSLLPAELYPIYLVEHQGEFMMASKSCFDCRLKGGSTVKPDFW